VSYAHDMSTRALDLLLEATTLLAADMRQGLAGIGLTESRAHLVYVLHERGPSTQRALAEALDVAPRTITTLVDALVETGFVTREPHPTDRRATQVTMTDLGEEVAAGMSAGREQLAEQLFAGLPALDALTDGLDEVVTRLKELLT
jgi:DNA-binding MarR family transcriptional regulator